MSRWWAEAVVVAPADVAGGASAVETVLGAFDDALGALAPRPGARFIAVVGGDAVRLRVVPWNPALTSPGERAVLARQSFVEAYGEAARGWAVCEQATRFGEAALAAAVDPALLAGLETMAAVRGLRLSGVRPAFTQAFNARRRDFGEGLAWFVWIERHVSTALLFSARAPVHVKRYAAPHAALDGLLAREWFALGREEPPCPVYVDRSAHVEGARRPETAEADA